MLCAIAVAMVLEIRRSLPFSYALGAACCCCLLAGVVAARQRAAWPGPAAITLLVGRLLAPADGAGDVREGEDLIETIAGARSGALDRP